MKVTPPGGSPIELGTTEAGATIGIVDYSRRETDAFGVTTVVRRDFSRRLSVRIGVATDRVDENVRLLASLRAKAALWAADDRFAWLSLTGFFEDLSIDLAAGDLSFCTLTVAGLAEREVVADGGGDPAPGGLTSTLRFIEPAEVTDAVLVSGSVEENDAPAWSSAVSYAIGETVIRGHRIYESLAAGNVGADPAAVSAKWLDTGPTNRWAMFDQALGTATIAGSPVEIVLDTDTAVSALALLDTNAGSVRVRAPGYDRTQVPDPAGKVLFLDLAAVAGAHVTVTIVPAAANPGAQHWNDGSQWMDAGVWRDSLAAGDGTVTIGTLLIGATRALGTTEASPSAGITDYSLKETDAFGEVTVVERAWAKNMAVKARIRTEALDVVANRMASMRARPALWIGDTATDSLIVYGFFRDFSIEVGENISQLSLSIEGLSKAAPVVPASGGSVAWPDITDPTGTKPTDNADKTSEHTSKDTAAVGGKPASEVLQSLIGLETVTIPAVNKAVADAGDRITAARSRADAAQARADGAHERIAGEIDRALDAEAALHTRIDSVSASGGYDDTAVKARIDDVEEIAISNNAARVTEIGTLRTTVTGNRTAAEAAIQRIDEAATSETAARVKAVSDLTTSVQGLDSKFTTRTNSIEQAAVDRDSATNQRIDTLAAEGGGGGESADTYARSEITRVDTAAVNRDNALGTRMDNVTARLATGFTIVSRGAASSGIAGFPDAGIYNAAGNEIVGRSRGYVVTRWSADSAIAGVYSFDTLGGMYDGGNAEMAAYLDGLPDGTTVTVHTFDEPQSNRLLPALTAAMERCGAGPAFSSPNFLFRGAYVLIGRAGVGRGMGREIYAGTKKNSGGDPIDAYIVEPFALLKGVPQIAGVGSVVQAGMTEIRTAFVAADLALAERSATLEAQMRGDAASGLRSRISTTEAALTDGRFATAARATTLEAQLARASPSAMNDAVNFVNGRIDARETAIRASIEDRATAIADAKVGAVTQTVQTLRGEYDATYAEVQTQKGVVADLNGKTAAYVRIIADAGNGPAVFSLWSDANGGKWALGGDGQIDGNLTINGTVTARAFNGPSMYREAASSWAGSLTPAPGETLTAPWSLSLPSIPPQGRFIFECTITVQSNVGTIDYDVDGQGRPVRTHYVADGGGAGVRALDQQGNAYGAAFNGSQRVIATSDFAPVFRASVSRGTRNETVDGGDYVNRYVAATYTLTSVDLKVTWVAI